VAWGVVPTTLLAMIDAAIGGKTAVDLGAGKNLLGAFWQPRFVLADVATLDTLPLRDLTAAGGEAIKYALLSGRPELEALSLAAAGRAALVTACAAQKAAVVMADERELSGARAMLNLGHTVGHALEAASWADATPLLHGEAVALGLQAAARISEGAGVAAPGLAVRVTRTCARLGLPTDLDARLGPRGAASVFALLGMDKKRAGDKLGFIVIEAPGKVRPMALTVDEIVGFLRAHEPG
jgi:3-dehydroquinate synthetase